MVQPSPKFTVQDSGNEYYMNRILIGTAATGLLRVEWVQARYGVIIPVNWANVLMFQPLDTYIPLRYQVDDAQNMIVREALGGDYEWLFLLEHDVCIPSDTLIRLNQYMRDDKVPVVSGLYYTRSRPSEPLVFRGRGTSVYMDWKQGDKVWCDGVPTGCLLIHCSILRAMWDESPEYAVRGQITRRVFETPHEHWFDATKNQFNSITGTSDLAWCDRVMAGGYFKKAGWPAYQKKKYPFLLDTGIFCNHVNPDGEMFP
jgi:hypothetical protein